MSDASLLLNWRNDRETRNASLQSAEVLQDEHLIWLRKTLSDPAQKLLVALDGDTPVGTVRACFADGVWELSWTTAPEARGYGVAKRMVEILAKQLTEPICANVKIENAASARVAQHVGMERVQILDGDIAHYRRGELM